MCINLRIEHRQLFFEANKCIEYQIKCPVRPSASLFGFEIEPNVVLHGISKILPDRLLSYIFEPLDR